MPRQKKVRLGIIAVSMSKWWRAIRGRWLTTMKASPTVHRAETNATKYRSSRRAELRANCGSRQYDSAAERYATVAQTGMISYSIRGVCLSAAGRFLPSLGVSILAVCPGCATPWLRIDCGASWRGWTLACPDCPSWPFDDSVPGSILTAIGSQDLGLLPLEVLKHELEVHLKFYEKGIQHGT